MTGLKVSSITFLIKVLSFALWAMSYVRVRLCVPMHLGIYIYIY